MSINKIFKQIKSNNQTEQYYLNGTKHNTIWTDKRRNRKRKEEYCYVNLWPDEKFSVKI